MDPAEQANSRESIEELTVEEEAAMQTKLQVMLAIFSPLRYIFFQKYIASKGSYSITRKLDRTNIR
jgi:hypothetical protein